MQKCKNSRLQKYKNTKLQKYKIRRGEIQVATTSAPVLLHLPHFLCAAPKPIYFYGPPASNLKKPLSYGVKKIYVLTQGPKMLLDSFQRNTIQFWKESYLPRNFLLGRLLFLGAPKECHTSFSCIGKCGSFCHLITKYTDDQNVIQHTQLVFFCHFKAAKVPNLFGKHQI